MIALYVTSIETFSGKTAVCLGLCKRLQSDGYRVGYFKPLGTLPYHLGEGVCSDEDALFAARALNLTEAPNVLSPVCLTQDLLEAQLVGPAQDLVSTVTQAYSEVMSEKDIVVLEGGASLREGYAVGLATPTVVRMLGASVICVIRYRSSSGLIDDALTAEQRLGDQLLGVLVNAVPPEGMRFVTEVGVPHLEKRQISVLGVLPEEARLTATSVGEIAAACEGEFLCCEDKANELVENLMVGAMGVEQARPRMQNIPNRAVITGGDRTDMIIAALEISAKVVVLTGGVRPSALIVRQAGEMGIPIVLTSHHTLRTVGLIERFFGKGRVAQPEKLAHFEALLAQHFNFARLYEILGLKFRS